jgi:hypothetical protein
MKSQLIAFMVDFADTRLKIIAGLDLTLHLLKGVFDLLHVGLRDNIE